MKKINTAFTIIFILGGVGVLMLFDEHASVSTSVKLNVVAKTSGVVQSLQDNPNTSSFKIATVLLENGTLIEASVPSACFVQIGKVTSLSIFQSSNLGSKFYMVSGSDP